MMTTTPRTARLALALAVALPALAACHREPPAPVAPAPASTASSTGPQTILGRSVEKAMAEARKELETGNLDLTNGVDIQLGEEHRRVRIGGDKGDTPAAITPQGDFLVDGKSVDVTPAQRELLLAYRQDVIRLAEAGMRIGVQGADLAGKAIVETLSGLMSGTVDDVGKRLDGEGKRLEAEAVKLCTLLPRMRQSQDALADALPAFKPYARLTQEDIDECDEEVRKSMASKGGAAAFSDTDRDALRDDIRHGVRDTVRAAVRGARDSTPEPAGGETR